ncbi:fatty acyl-CoA reductase 1 [Halyomorpha halys]|uniref:fatty acyl-CoA reductase 1 n=1 Tax=Halyomorpha halys TaxID=286706 RepID=UPI000D0C8216|nr:fatty acyl-CoA reductase 1-like [Halyomorpha halys]
MDYFERRDNVSLCKDANGNVPERFENFFSDIQQFYENKNVFITDSCGLGGRLVERLLRSCPKIGTIYLLVKPENKLHEERSNELLFSELNEKIKKTHDCLNTKIRMVHGDYTQPFCGISEFDRKMLIDEIQIMFHIAGAPNKYENLKSLYHENIQSTRSLLELAGKMKKMKAFIYVSTIRAKKFQQDIEEKFHERIFSENNSKSREEELQAIAAKLVGNREELSDFTKAVAEEVVRKYKGKIPIAIARSSNEFSCQKYNMSKWKKIINISTGPYLELIDALKYCYGIQKNSVSPDNFINTIIAISWLIGTNTSNRNDTNTQVYDITTWNSRISTNCGEHLTEDTNLIYQVISKQCLGINKPHMKNQKWMYYQKKYIYPVLFLLLLDLYLKIYANTNKLLNTFVKTDDYSLSSEYYHSQAWNNKLSNVDKLWSSMSNVDKKLFNFDIIHNEWEQCNGRNIRNMIAHLFKEDLSELEMNNVNYIRYQQVKMCMKILMFNVSAYFILNRGILILLKCLNELFL